MADRSCQGPSPGVRRTLGTGGVSPPSPAAGSSTPQPGLRPGIRLPAASPVLHGPAPRSRRALATASARASLGHPGLLALQQLPPRPRLSGAGAGSREPGRGPLSAETRGGPARAPLARALAPGSNPSDWLGHSRPTPPPDDRARSLPARQGCQSARRAVRTSGTSPPACPCRAPT